MKKYLVCVAVILCGVMCGKKQDSLEKPTGVMYSENFITRYVTPEKLALHYVTTQPRYLKVLVEGKNITDKTTRRALAERYNDLSYNRTTYLFGATTEPAVSVIDITCDRRFDYTHDAGASLADAMKLCAISYKSYVETGYQISEQPWPQEFSNVSIDSGEGVCTPLFKPLSEVTASDLTLMAPWFYLYFPVSPEPGDYDFTVTVRMGDKTLSGEQHVWFE